MEKVYWKHTRHFRSMIQYEGKYVVIILHGLTGKNETISLQKKKKKKTWTEEIHELGLENLFQKHTMTNLEW